MNFKGLDIYAHKTLNNKLNQIIASIILIFLHADIANADLHIIYSNSIKNNQKHEIYVKNNLFKSKNAQNRTTIVDFEKKCIYLFKEDFPNYLKLPLKDARANISKDRKEPFHPRLNRTNKQANIAGLQVSGYRYSSEIDEEVELLVSKNINAKTITTLANGITALSYEGNELLKQPAYFYSLKNDMVPLSIKSKNDYWQASLADEKEMTIEEFAPKGIELSIKDYMREIVDKVSKDVESKRNP